MNYNFTDEAQPNLNAVIGPTGDVDLANGTIQGDLITDAFSDRSISVSIVPPTGWSLDAVVWSGGGTGTLSVPDPGVETSHPFTYTVSQNGTSLSASGTFKLKRQSEGDPGTGG